MNSPKILVHEDEEKNKTFDTIKSLQKFWSIIPGVTNLIEEEIKRFVKSIQSLVLIDICLTGEDSTQTAYISQDNSSLSVLYLTEDSENTNIICLPFQTIYLLKKIYIWLSKWLSTNTKYPKDCNSKSNNYV